MGNKVVVFSEEQLEHYQDCTFFTRKEILRVWKKYKGMINDSSSTPTPDLLISFQVLEQMPELRENPFRRRICQVFSNSKNEEMTFEEFLYMLSVFSEQASRKIKVYYAFKIYDFDNDLHIGQDDIVSALKLLTQNELTLEEMNQVYDKIIEEADVDGDGKLSFIEFNHVILKAPDFLSTFHIRI